jgi:hypothetical protein
MLMLLIRLTERAQTYKPNAMASAPAHAEPPAVASNPAISNRTILSDALNFCNVAPANDDRVAAVGSCNANARSGVLASPAASNVAPASTPQLQEQDNACHA